MIPLLRSSGNDRFAKRCKINLSDFGKRRHIMDRDVHTILRRDQSQSVHASQSETDMHG